jgi:2-polyprenyl-3-methyl-5-hydroxy-6-metoxy-1,4-benzoquinol methylase
MTDGTGDFSARAIRGSDCGYTAFHAPRYAYALDVLARSDVHAGASVLDIGQSRLSELIHERFGCRVDTLGFGNDHATEHGQHFGFDLNRTQNDEEWRRDLPRYDAIVMAEVIEHLYTAPQRVLAFLFTLLVPGGLLLVQTPNAAGLTRRIKLLFGYNPYDMIRLDTSNPGHFREYTRAELRRLATSVGFRVEDLSTHFYFDMRFARHGEGDIRPQPVLGTLRNLVYAAIPRSLRWGLSVQLRRPSEAADVI